MRIFESQKLRTAIVSVLVLALVQTSGCYYMQAMRGHLDIMNKRQAIPEVIADDDSPEQLRQRLLVVQEAREYAIEKLLLADNDSYRSYADLGRDYVVWNVFAAPEFSLEPKTWCFPVAGCVAYRGYFDEDDAQKKANDLREDGFDVVVGGVSAYSTLGRFDDPVLNTMMRWSDTRLVATIFHELAHQKLYVKGDTAFNESFATAVSDIGISRWLNDHDDTASFERLQRNRELRRSMMALVREARDELNELYSSDVDATTKRQNKHALFNELSASGARLAEANGAETSNLLAPPLNNARLISLGLYEGYQEAFGEVYRACREDLACFYAESERLALLDADERRQALAQVSD